MPLTVSMSCHPTHLAPQVVHVLVDDVGAAVVGEVPDGLDDLRPGQHPARMAEEELEQGELLRRQVKLGPGPPGALGRRVQPEVTLGQDHRAGPVVPPGQRAQPRGQLEQAERLDQVVVRARVEPPDPVADPVPGRQHQHRNPDARLAQPPAHTDPVQAGQHDIQHDRPVGVLRRQPQPLQAVRGDVHRVALLLQRALEQPGHPGLVLDHEHSHGPVSSSSACRRGRSRRRPGPPPATARSSRPWT